MSNFIASARDVHSNKKTQSAIKVVAARVKFAQELGIPEHMVSDKLIRHKIEQLGRTHGEEIKQKYLDRLSTIEEPKTFILREPLVDNHRYTLHQLAKDIAWYFGVSVTDIRGPKRARVMVFIRSCFCYYARRLTKKSYTEIGIFLCGRDHTTVIHMVKNYKQRKKNVRQFM